MRLCASTTLIIFIDPQKAFCSQGATLATAFGVDEVQPVVQALQHAARFFNTVPAGAATIIVRSAYELGQFSGGDPNASLGMLCVPGHGKDCDLIDELNPPNGTKIVTKHQKDACSCTEFLELLNSLLAKEVRDIIVLGCLITSCVKASVVSICQCTGNRARVWVASDYVGARRSNHEVMQGQSAVQDAFAEMKRAGALVLPSGRSLELV